MSSDLTVQIELQLQELDEIGSQLEPLFPLTREPEVGVIETAAASAMLHSFYTGIEKIFKRIAQELDSSVPGSDSWHRDLLRQMTEPRLTRPPVVLLKLAETLGEFLAFRHFAEHPLS